MSIGIPARCLCPNVGLRHLADAVRGIFWLKARREECFRDHKHRIDAERHLTSVGMVAMRNFRQMLLISGLAFGSLLAAQQNPSAPQPQQNAAPAAAANPQAPGAGHDVGSGAGDIGKGAGGAAGHVAEGTGKGAVDLVTLHPVNAAGAVGTGAAKGGKDLGVGTAKGTGKIVKGTGKGIGKGFKKIF
jgi:hypothetical protein